MKEEKALADSAFHPCNSHNGLFVQILSVAIGIDTHSRRLRRRRCRLDGLRHSYLLVL